MNKTILVAIIVRFLYVACRLHYRVGKASCL